MGFAWRMVGGVEPRRLAVAIVLFAISPIADQLAGWAAAAIVAGLLGGLCVKRSPAPR